ncbi:MAG: anthranilate synthase component I [Balneolaceae bacterium]
MDLNTFKKLADTYTAVPVSRRLLADVMTPVSLFLAIRDKANYPFLLESVEGGEHLARYSFIGKNPYQVLRFDGEETTIEHITGEQKKVEDTYFNTLNRLTTQYTEPELPDLPRLTGGAVGFSSYDTVRQVESLPSCPEADIRLPEAIWAFYDEIFAFDHVKQQVVLIKTVFLDQKKAPEVLFRDAVEALDRMEREALSLSTVKQHFTLKTELMTSNVGREQFHDMVKTAKKYIYEGDIFQVVLSQRFQVPFSGDKFMLYRALRMVNPSPYLFFLDFDEFALVGSSPEVLVRVQHEKAQLLPIAGTRPRGQNREEDLDYEKELKNDPKEIAEHIMLVDLGRNDLSRVCKPGTVKLERNQVIERYSHVMHIVSDVTGDLDPAKTSVDALMQCFPAGTVSGAPKIRAMEIIDELEPTKRGPYAGAVGYFDFSGNMDTCIVIRTMLVTDDSVYIQAGAGIVADSDPENEYQETKNKAKALIEALKVALALNESGKEE